MNAPSEPSLAFFGDNDGGRVVVVDLTSWKQLHDIGTGSGPYPVDRVGPDLLFASTRRDEAMSVIKLASLTVEHTLELRHTPRSTTPHPSRPLALVSGGNRALTSVIDVSGPPKVLEVVGSGEALSPAENPSIDFGGQLATGHPAWLDEGTRFFQLNRITRRLQVYDVGASQPLWSVNVPTSIHHILRYPGENGRWYAVCEGNQFSRTPPSLLRLEEQAGRFAVTSQLFLPVPLQALPNAGGHHSDRAPDDAHVYFGSAEGSLYVINRHRMEVVDRLDAGKGCGHTRVARGRGLGIITNHDDSFLTVFDIAARKVVKTIQITSGTTKPQKKQQGHTSGVDPQERYYYHTASIDGRVLRIDLDRLDISDADYIDVGGYPIQGDFVWRD
ncbi:MAG TPA: hypothetical protein VF631_07715 [Allosphingosinicella sp.]|jgi:hypothetical protein|uniref:YncE family protein n=1 Tax=Allosphingosinicella sp. TaxID=2823234 RepID=UPI002F27062E